MIFYVIPFVTEKSVLILNLVKDFTKIMYSKACSHISNQIKQGFVVMNMIFWRFH